MRIAKDDHRCHHKQSEEDNDPPAPADPAHISNYTRRQQRSNAWLEIALAEGKNREVRRVLAHLDLPVMRLIRIAFGPFHLGELPLGLVDEIPAQALDNLLGVKRPPRKAGWAKPRPKGPQPRKRRH